MRHKKQLIDEETGEVLATCGGRVFVDRLYPIDKRVELYCVKCGHRWYVKRDGSAFVSWVSRLEVTRNALHGTSS